MPASVLFHGGAEAVPAMPVFPASMTAAASTSSAPPLQEPEVAPPGDAVAVLSPAPASQRIGTGAAAGEMAISLDDRLMEVESSLITWALKASGGNKSKAAGLLRIKRSTLGDRINRCGLGRSTAEVAV
jgi:DNA-binding NtrC family response regulator